MHIPDGFVSGPINAGGALLAVAAVGLSAWRASREVQQRPYMIPLLATTAAFVFAAQMLNFPIGGGTSGHFLGAAMVAALLGPWSACLVMALVLTVQCLAFADGGLTALGTNIVNMGVVGGIGAYVFLRIMRAVLPGGRMGYLLAAAVASWVGVVAAATACALELAFSGTSPLGVALPAMAITHAVIGIGEALIAVAVLSVVAATRRDILPEWSGIGEETSVRVDTRRAWRLAGAGLVVALAIAVFASPFASGSPDGLEKVAEDRGFIESAEGKEVWQGSPLPDYTIPHVRSESLSTGLAGLLGTAGVFTIGFVAIRLLGKRSAERES